MSDEMMKQVLDIRSLAIFRSLKDDPVVGGLCDLMERLAVAGSKGNGAASDPSKGNGAASDPSKGNEAAVDIPEIVELYSNVISALYPVTSDLGEYIRCAVLADDNFYVEAVASGDPIGDEIQTAVKGELIILQEVAAVSSERIKKQIGEVISSRIGGGHESRHMTMSIASLPKWSNGSINLLRDFMDKLNDLGTTGYGIFAEYPFFRIADGEIVPVPYPDVQPLSELFGYERQKQQIIRNTEALLEGGSSSSASASNMLLYGDAGTGKSSTVKAVAFEYAKKGLRLIEVKKEQLHMIPTILDDISRQPLKFILFIDDLSFSGNDDNFSALKATLEGSITGRGANAVIYATSNRRHLIRESFSDRDGDELHVNDTLQETMSLAARFGLTVMFENPDRDEYLNIVSNLAKLNDIDMDEGELFKKAEAHAIRRNGRSPRTARQFVELLKTDLIG